MAAVGTGAQRYGTGPPQIGLAPHVGQAAAAAPPAPVQPVETVPEIVEDTRNDEHGNVIVRHYQRGRLLGKVSVGAARAARAPLLLPCARLSPIITPPPRSCRVGLRAASSSRASTQPRSWRARWSTSPR